MPSSATITAFYNFTANTKARASQVNANFDVFRGHLIPVNPLTATAMNASYDLGSNVYRWRNAYLNTLNIQNTNTAYLSLSMDAATTSAEALISVNGGSSILRITDTGLYGQIITRNETAGSNATLVQVTLNSAEIGFVTLNPGGYPVELSLKNANATAGSITQILFQVASTLPSGEYDKIYDYVVYKNTITTTSEVYRIRQRFRWQNIDSPNSNGASWSFTHSPNAFSGIDYNTSSTSTTYYFFAAPISVNVSFDSMFFYNVRPYARIIK